MKVRVGILSYGMSGKVFHCPLLHVNPGFEMKKIMQRTSNDALDRYPYVQIVRSADEIFNDPEIDVVLVNTPDHTHFEYTKAALEAGKHVVVEKPFIHEYSEGETLIELARKKKRILTVFQSRRWEGDFLTLKKIIENGFLGRLVTYEAHFDRFRNFIRESWKEKPELKASTLYNLGSHLIDQALLLFGMPEAVYADLRKQRTGSRVDDLFDLNLYYPGLKVTLKSSYLVREPGPRFMLHGTEGSFVKYGVDPQEEALIKGHYPDEPGWGKEPETNWGILNTTLNGIHFRGPVETTPGCYQEFYNLLYETIVNGKELAVKPEESLMGIKIIKSAYESDERRSAILTK
ncbi:MAG TPA: Gfo/Idh/MocA family oxidoreductase [Bacteroidales bacterium]|jgi:predicted dehydrogenase|nr:Gfo/Idh/MocA family oxidoreductase [Bacteroidales bacterium]